MTLREKIRKAICSEHCFGHEKAIDRVLEAVTGERNDHPIYSPEQLRTFREAGWFDRKEPTCRTN